MAPQKALIILITTLLAISILPTATASDYTITDVEVSPNPPKTGDPTTFTVHIKNTGNERIKFVEESQLKLKVDGELQQSVNLLIKPNYTDPALYLNIDPGDTGTWDLVTVQKTTGTKLVEIILEGPYEYGGKQKGLKVHWTDDIKFVNPEVKKFDIWITQYDWGIKPTITIANGKAYTGTAHLSITRDNEQLYSKNYTLTGTHIINDEIRRENFFQENGTYTLKVDFLDKTAQKQFTINEGQIQENQPPQLSNDTEQKTIPGFNLPITFIALCITMFIGTYIRTRRNTDKKSR